MNLPVKCTQCGEMITIRGTQKDSLVMGNIDSERLPFHKGCFHIVHNPMNNPAYRAKLVGDKNPSKRPEVRAKISKALTGRPHPWMVGDKNPMKRPEIAKKNAKSRRGQLRPTISGDKNPAKRPEVRAKISKKLMGRDAHWMKGDKNPMRNPETAAKQGMATRGDKHYMNRPEHRARMVGDKNPMKRPEVAAKVSKALMGKPQPWKLGDKNPLRNPKHYDTWRKAMSMRPNRTEAGLIPILGDFGFVYLKKIEIRRAPDFVHKTEQRVIEFDGFAGHNPTLPWNPDTWEGCLALDDKRDQAYRDAGYRVLRVLPEDLAEGDDFVRAKVEEWMLEG